MTHKTLTLIDRAAIVGLTMEMDRATMAIRYAVNTEKDEEREMTQLLELRDKLCRYIESFETVLDAQ